MEIGEYSEVSVCRREEEHTLTSACVFIRVQVVTRTAAAAVASDVIVTEMRTLHLTVLPALIDICKERSKVSLLKLYFLLKHWRRPTLSMRRCYFTLGCVKSLESCMSLRVGVVGVEVDRETASRGRAERGINRRLELLEGLFATQVSKEMAILRNLPKRNRKNNNNKSIRFLSDAKNNPRWKNRSAQRTINQER